MEELINENPKDFITIYKEVEKAIRTTFQEEETDQDKLFFLNDINKVIKELYRVLEK